MTIVMAKARRRRAAFTRLSLLSLTRRVQRIMLRGLRFATFSAACNGSGFTVALKAGIAP